MWRFVGKEPICNSKVCRALCCISKGYSTFVSSNWSKSFIRMRDFYEDAERLSSHECMIFLKEIILRNSFVVGLIVWNNYFCIMQSPDSKHESPPSRSVFIAIFFLTAEVSNNSWFVVSLFGGRLRLEINEYLQFIFRRCFEMSRNMRRPSFNCESNIQYVSNEGKQQRANSIAIAKNWFLKLNDFWWS